MGMKKITWAEIAEFEKDFTLKVLANPTYRYGQAFLNYFPWVSKSMDEDGDLDAAQGLQIWNCSNRLEVLDLVDWYIEDNDS